MSFFSCEGCHYHINIFFAHNIPYFFDHYREGFYSGLSRVHVWILGTRNTGCVEWQLSWGLGQKSCSMYVVSMEFWKGFMIFFTEFNFELSIDANLARLLGCSLGLLNMRRTLAPLLHLSRPVVSCLMIICWWNTSCCAIAATYCSLRCWLSSILTRE